MDKEIINKLSELDKRMTKLEVVIHGSNGHGGLYEKQEETYKAVNDLKKAYWVGIGSLAVLQMIIIPLTFKFLKF